MSSIQEAGIAQVKICFVPTATLRHGVYRSCYGRNRASGKLVEIGVPSGRPVLGEPGTVPSAGRLARILLASTKPPRPAASSS